jgi:hypothetical protein
MYGISRKNYNARVLGLLPGGIHEKKIKRFNDLRPGAVAAALRRLS